MSDATLAQQSLETPRQVGLRPDREHTLPRVRQVPVVWIIALSAVAVRLPLLGRPPTPDEAGFLLVGAQWHAGGTSLYGDYWVDRPPLLITIFRLASEGGGLVPLRLIGCVATLLTILGVAHVARRLGGTGAAAWSAVVAAALLVNPLTGAMAVNGELLAAPFVIWGIAAMVGAFRDRPHGPWLAAAAGAALVCSLLVKQNFADVGVFTVVALPLALWRRELTAHRARALLTRFVGGALAALVVASVWTLLHGTSLAGVFDAMYPFRVEAEKVLASPANHGSGTRLTALMVAWALCGGAVLMVMTAWAVSRRRLAGTVVWALAATGVFEAASVLLGGSYWSHYLVQLVAPLSVLAGTGVARAIAGMRTVIVVAAVAAVVGWTVAVPWQYSSVEKQVGSSIAAVASPNDTIVSLYGHAQVTRASGLSSPYPYLWSLPTKTLDPDLRLLVGVLSGPTAPTWFVTWNGTSSWGVDSGAAARVLAARYHAVAHPDGHTIYLRNGVHRPAPGPLSQASSPPTLSSIAIALKEFLP
jgi:hypothetical protein